MKDENAQIVKAVQAGLHYPQIAQIDRITISKKSRYSDRINAS